MTDFTTNTTEQVFKGFVIREARAHGHVSDGAIAHAVEVEGDIDGLPITLADAWDGFLAFLRHLEIPPSYIAYQLHVGRREVPERGHDSAIMEPAKKGFLQGFSEAMGADGE